MFSCEICEVLKKTYFEEHLRTTASIVLLVQEVVPRLLLYWNGNLIPEGG